MGIQQGQDDNGQVPSDAEHVGDEQKDKDHNLKVWVIWQSQEDKLLFLYGSSFFSCLFVFPLPGDLQKKAQGI